MKDGRPFAELRKPEQVKLWESLWFVSTGRYDSIRWTVSAGKARHQQLHPLQLDVCFQGVLREQHCYAKGRHTCDALFEAKLSCVICVFVSKWEHLDSGCPCGWSTRRGAMPGACSKSQLYVLCDISRLSLQRWTSKIRAAWFKTWFWINSFQLQPAVLDDSMACFLRRSSRALWETTVKALAICCSRKPFSSVRGTMSETTCGSLWTLRLKTHLLTLKPKKHLLWKLPNLGQPCLHWWLWCAVSR